MKEVTPFTQVAETSDYTDNPNFVRVTMCLLIKLHFPPSFVDGAGQ
jgi:hypothetical protein